MLEEGSYSSSSEYLRQLIREKREEARFRQLLIDGRESGLSSQNHEEIMADARQLIAQARERRS